MSKECVDGITYHVMNRQLKEMIDKAQIVSFDVFDTLIHRSVGNPSAVFDSMDVELGMKYGMILREFADVRRKAKTEARKKTSYEEITIEEIYNNIHTVGKNDAFNMEIQLETEVSVQNKDMKEVFDYCIKKEKRVVICSDMYLDKATIEAILKKNGYEGYAKLYLSSEYRKRKRSGTLFEELLQSEQVKASSVLHIGDNWRNDFYQPRKHGLKAYHYAKRKYYSFPDEPGYALLYGDWIVGAKDEEYWESLGEYVLGNFLFGYAKWLVRKFEKEGFERIYFLSRDGYMIQRAVMQLAPESIREKCRYLYTSRMVMVGAAIHLFKDYEQRCQLISWKRHFDIRFYIEMMGLTFDEHYPAIASIVPDIDTVFSRDDLLTDQRLLQCYAALEEAINENSKNAYNMILAYLQQEGVHGKVALVDTGWRANIQTAIEAILKSARVEADIHGYYMGIRKECRTLSTQKMDGYLYFGLKGMREQLEQMENTNIIERFCAEDSGSLKYFDIEGEKVVPIIAENTMNDMNRSRLRIVQEAALKRIAQLNGIKAVRMEFFDPRVYFHGFKKVSIYPTMYDSWKIAEFLGDQEIHGTAYYALHPAHLKRDIYKVVWKNGILKRTMRLKLDYRNVHGILDKVQRKKAK